MPNRMSEIMVESPKFFACQRIFLSEKCFWKIQNMSPKNPDLGEIEEQN